tara:strand:- start:50 stop:553 length:504 start_codon:yes stop_codon:yes gene_type:complete
MSELRTNRIVPRDGLPSGSSGGIIQIKQAIHSDSVDYSSNSLTAGSSSGGNFEITITPTRSDSKILLSLTSMYDNNTGGQRAFITFYRSIDGGTAENVLTGTGAGRGVAEIWNNDQRIQSTVMAQYLDSPATTSPVTYTVYAQASTGNFYLGLYSNQKFIQAMEVSG